MMKERRLLMNWSWLKRGDTRQPVGLNLHVEVDERDDDAVLLSVDLTPEQVTALLSGSAIHVQGKVGT